MLAFDHTVYSLTNENISLETEHIFSISVIIMAYNEENGLASVVEEIYSILLELVCPFEIIIIDDGSTDHTAEIAENLVNHFPGVYVIHHSLNIGLGGVYKTGFQEARNDLLTFFPSDGQFSANIIKQFYPLMKNTDLILGYLPKRNDSLLGITLSLLERLFYYFLFGPIPKFQGIFMVRRYVLSQISLVSQGRGWGIIMEFIIRVHRQGYRIINIPTEIQPRKSGNSKVNNIRTISANFTQLIKLRKLI